MRKFYILSEYRGGERKEGGSEGERRNPMH